MPLGFWIAVLVLNIALILLWWAFEETIVELLNIPRYKVKFYFQSKQIQKEFARDFVPMQEDLRESLIHVKIHIGRTHDIGRLSLLFQKKEILEDGIFLLESLRLIREMDRFEDFKKEWLKYQTDLKKSFQLDNT